MTIQPSIGSKTVTDQRESVIITRMSHSSWFKIAWGRKTIHIDPGFSGLFENQHVPEKELESGADYVLISHCHKDHLRPEMIERICGPDTILVGPACCTDLLGSRCRIVRPGDAVTFGDFGLATVHAYNTPEGHSTRKGHPRGEFVGFVLTLAGIRMYFAGDTDFIPEMAGLGPIDIAFLPIGGTYVMDPEEATLAVAVIRPIRVIPMHQADHDMVHFRELVQRITAAEVILLDVGNYVSI